MVLAEIRFAVTATSNKNKSGGKAPHSKGIAAHSKGNVG
jgi:hypothetical protein